MILLGFYALSGVCLWVLLAAIVLNFYFSRRGVVKKEKKSVVETGSMLGFFLLMVVLAAKKIGFIHLDFNVLLLAAAIGTLLILVGTVVNLAGRLKLRGNWGNQIRIYENHTLTVTGIYHYIRHPLYASTILMLYGFSLLMANAVVLLLTTVVFLPFMLYRAKQEDTLLLAAFGETFAAYREKTGMFVPKLRRRR